MDLKRYQEIPLEEIKKEESPIEHIRWQLAQLSMYSPGWFQNYDLDEEFEEGAVMQPSEIERIEAILIPIVQKFKGGIPNMFALPKGGCIAEWEMGNLSIDIKFKCDTGEVLSTVDEIFPRSSRMLGELDLTAHDENVSSKLIEYLEPFFRINQTSSNPGTN
jgi:hypothetical protein